MSKHSQHIFLGLAALMMLILFISSAMTYHQQTIVPELQAVHWPWLHRLLGQIHFDYAGHAYSAELTGYSKLLEFLLRKTAHFGSYFLLGGFAYLGLADAVPPIGFRLSLTWLATIGYAATDEFHQGLTGDRSPMIEDVMLDASGALVGVLLAALILALILRHRRRTQFAFTKVQFWS